MIIAGAEFSIQLFNTSDLSLVNEIVLSLPKLDSDIAVDKYRFIWIGEIFSDNLVAFVSFFND